MANEKNDIASLAADVASFIERAAPVLDKTAKLDTALGQKLPQVVGRLVELGVIPANMKQAKLTQFSEDPSLVCDLLLKVASRVAAPSTMGGPGEVSAPAIEKMSADDAFKHNVLNATRRA
jgi:hypothetical protein